MAEQDVTIRFVGVDAGLSGSANQAVGALGQLEAANQRLGAATAASSQQITALALALGTNYKQAQAFSGALAETDRSVTSLSQKLKGAATATGLTAEKTNQAIVKLRELNKAGADNAEKFKVLNRELGVTQAQFEKLNKAAASTREGLATIAAGTGVLAAGIGAAFGKGIQTFAAFDAAIRTFGAVTESTGTPALAALRAEVERLGIETQKTPQEIANVAIELGKAGFSAEQTTAALQGVVLGSQATGESLGRLGEVIGATINQFSLTASDSAKIADLLVATSNASASGVNDLGEALSYVGPQAKASGQDLKTTLLVLGELANAGIKGSSAGTGLAEALRRIKLASANATTSIAELESRGAKKAVAAFKILNQQVRDSSGQLLPFPEVLEKVKVGLAGLDQPNKELLLDALFGVQGGRAVQALLNSNVAQVNSLSSALENANGAASRTSSTLTQGLSASFVQLQSSTSVALQRFGEFAAGGLEPVVRGAALLVNSFLKLPAPIQASLIAVTGFTGVLAAAIAAYTAFNLVNGAYIIATTRATAAQLLANAQTALSTGATIAQTAAITGLNFARNADLIAIGKQQAAQLLLTLRTQATTVAQGIGAAAQTAYALATGRGTEAAIAQAAALKLQAAGFVGTAASAGVFAAAIASIALATNSFNESLKAANALQQGVSSVDDALGKLDEANQKAAKSQGQFAQAAGSEASRNLESLQKDLNVFAQATDTVINFINGIFAKFSLQSFFKELAKLDNLPAPLKALLNAIANFKLSTIADASASQVGAAFDDLVSKSTETLNRFKELDIGKATKEQLQAQNDAIAASIAALEAAKPVEESDINRRNLQIEALKKAQDALKNYGTATNAAATATQQSTASTQENAQALEDAAQKRADALKQTRENQSTQQERTFQDQSQTRDRQFQTQKQAAEQTFQDAAQNRDRQFQASQQAAEQAFKDKQQADEQSFKDRQQATEQSFKDRLQQAEAAFKDRQQADEDSFNEQQRAKEKTFRDNLKQEEDSFNASQQDREDKFKSYQRATDARVQAEFNAEKKALDQQIEQERRGRSLKEAQTPADRRKLEEQFRIQDSEESRKAALDARLNAAKEADAEARQAEEERFKQNQQAREDKFKEAQQQKEEKFKAILQAKEVAFKEAQQAQETAFKAAEQTAEQAFKEAQQEVEQQFKAVQQENERAFKLEQQTTEQTFKDQEREKDRAFKAEQQTAEQAFKDGERALDRAFKDEQRAKDLEVAQQAKAIIESARTPTIEGRYTGGTMTAGTPYWVGEGAGGRILPSSEIIVPGTNSYAVAADRARTWLTQSAQPDRALLAEIQSLRSTIESREPMMPITANFPTEGMPFDRYLQAQRAVIRAMI